MTRTQRQIEEHRKGMARIQLRDRAGRPCAGVSVWAEQESHTFAFGCVAPKLEMLAEADRQRGGERLAEVFNRIVPADPPADPNVLRYEVPAGVPLGRIRVDLDRLTAAGLPLEIHVRGCSLGLGVALADRMAAERVVALYTLGFAHSAVRGIVWHGFWNGEEDAAGGGLLRRDLSPQPAFQLLRKLIGSVWHSRASGETDAAGLFAFRGFFGNYRVAARRGEEAATTAVISHRGGDEPVLFQLLDELAIADGTAAR